MQLVCIFSYQLNISRKFEFLIATCLRWGGGFMDFVANFTSFPAVQKFWKSVKIWQSYRQFKGGNFFETQCSYTNAIDSPTEHKRAPKLLRSQCFDLTFSNSRTDTSITREALREVLIIRHGCNGVAGEWDWKAQHYLGLITIDTDTNVVN